ncbi:hypothetical protein [Pontimicrobium aquaticum]|uniref:Uncharacterized protein n=1 Tax=Pontimicrobium aquaticum TaxID=2565367 RepID=A0A4U0EY25_9FLAO|nr:hypothetical protein [Pontimicrobium aquaticum]TJY36304.1 hypothetical protein E5167_06460 [Pontimicrobium aquaticum]
MKHIKLTFVLLLFFNCQNSKEEHVAIGTWNKCDKDGSYIEWKITNQYMLILTTRSNEIFLFKNNIINNNLVLSEFKNGTRLVGNNDTVVTVRRSKNKIILRSRFTGDYSELNKAEFDFEPIDSTNLELWRKNILSEFNRRASNVICTDTRNKDEKRYDFEVENIGELEMDKLDKIKIDSIEN